MKPLSLASAASVLGIAVLLPSHSVAQPKLSPEALVSFVVAASAHEALLLELEAQCPPANRTKPLVPDINKGVSALSAEIAKSIAPLQQVAESVAKLHAAQLVKNAQGCGTATYRELHAAMEKHMGSFFIRWMQKDL